MRKAINENPMVQIGVLAGAAVIFAFILFTSVLKKDDTAAPATRPPRRRPATRPRPRPPTGSPPPIRPQPRVHCSRRRHGRPADRDDVAGAVHGATGRRLGQRRPAALEGPAEGSPRRVRQEQRDRPARHRSERDLRQAGQGLHGDRSRSGTTSRSSSSTSRTSPITRGSPRASRSAASPPSSSSSRASSPTRYRPPRSPTASAARAASTRRSTTRSTRASRSRPTRRAATRRRTRARTASSPVYPSGMDPEALAAYLEDDSLLGEPLPGTFAAAPAAPPAAI